MDIHEERDFLKERRLKPRRNVIVAQYSSGKSGAHTTGIPKDISAEGMSLVMGKKTALGSILKLALYISKDKEPISVKGKVKWVRDYLEFPYQVQWIAGIEFINLSQETRHTLHELSEKKRLT